MHFPSAMVTLLALGLVVQESAGLILVGKKLILGKKLLFLKAPVIAPLMGLGAIKKALLAKGLLAVSSLGPLLGGTGLLGAGANLLGAGGGLLGTSAAVLTGPAAGLAGILAPAVPVVVWDFPAQPAMNYAQLPMTLPFPAPALPDTTHLIGKSSAQQHMPTSYHVPGIQQPMPISMSHPVPDVQQPMPMSYIPPAVPDMTPLEKSSVSAVPDMTPFEKSTLSALPDEMPYAESPAPIAASEFIPEVSQSL